MAKTYKCTNFANCDKALTKELIEISDAEDFSCPAGESECQKKYLQPADGFGGGGGKTPPGGIPKPLLWGAVGLVVIGTFGFFMWPSSPNQPLADSMITEFFPRLK